MPYLPNPHLPVLIEFKSVTKTLFDGRNVTSLSVLYRYFHAMCSYELHFILAPARTLQLGHTMPHTQV